MNILEKIQHSFYQTLKQIFKLSEINPAVTISLNTDPQKQQFGDLTTNSALILAKELGKNPREIAQIIIEHFKDPSILRMEIAGPGFINLFLTTAAFQQVAQELFTQQEDFFKHQPALDNPEHYNIEFVSANPTGPLHIGHGRGGIIGDVFGNIVHFIGHEVTKEFYINDAGSQISKLGISLKVRCEQLLGMPSVLPEDGYHGEYLSEFAQQCIQEQGKEVIDRDVTFFAEYAEQHCLAMIKNTLAAYGITYDVWFSEKTLHESGAIDKVVAILKEKNFIYERDDAWWFASTSFGDDKDRVVKRANGEWTYVAADIAYLQNKINRGAQKMVMVLGQDHHSYVTRLKAVMSALGYNPDNLSIILYQLVTLKESGQLLKLSKRAGRIVSLADVIETVGKDVARFFYLNRKADAHLDFDLELALKHTEENPVYYIQYAYVRTNSILEKAYTFEDLKNIDAADAAHLDQAEMVLLKKILSLKELLFNISNNHQTHLLTYYTLELAHAFHSYYGAHKVIDQQNIQQSRARLLLIILLQQTFKLCLNLLGISAPKTM